MYMYMYIYIYIYIYIYMYIYIYIYINLYVMTDSLDKTEAAWVGWRGVEEKYLKQTDSFIYLGGLICGDDDSDTDIRKMITAWERNGEKDTGHSTMLIQKVEEDK